jgi:hypothetical protein
MNTNTPTPRTDERKASFALDTIRQLETELTAVTEQRDKEREIYGKSYSAELARSNHYKQQRDRLAEACKKLMAIIGETNSLIDDYWVSKDEMDEAWNIADEALQSLTTNEL